MFDFIGWNLLIRNYAHCTLLTKIWCTMLYYFDCVNSIKIPFPACRNLSKHDSDDHSNPLPKVPIGYTHALTNESNSLLDY